MARRRCKKCKGKRRVAMLGHGMGPFNDYVGKPMPMTQFEAMAILEIARGRKNSSMVDFIIRDAISGLTATPCPWCATFRVQQMPHEPSKIPS